MTMGTLRGSRTNVRCRAISGRSSVTVKKKRKAATEPLMVGGRTPVSVCSSWKQRRSSGVAVSGERPRNAAKVLTWRM
jgi:hypothetical protein